LDSRFGENYWFDVAGPIRLNLAIRFDTGGAIPSPDFVNVVDQTAIKKSVFPHRDRIPDLSRRARMVRNVAFTKAVWIDLHVFDRDAARIEAKTIGLAWEGSAGGFADLFRFQGEIYRG